MTVVSPSLPSLVERHPQVRTGGPGFGPPPSDAGGNDDRSEGDGRPDYREHLRRARMGMLFATAPILMLFGTFSAALILRHTSVSFDPRSNVYVRNWDGVPLPLNLLFINTAILFCSSVTIEVARRRIAGDVALAPVKSIPGISVGRELGFRWIALTAVLGLVFLGGQTLAWSRLVNKGFYFSTGANSSFVYLLTATHAVHLAGGIAVLAYALAVYFFHRPVESRHIIVDVAAWYWHLMFLLWVYVFALLKFAQS